MKNICAVTFAIALPIFLVAQENESTDYLKNEIETQVVLLQAERLLGEFIESPRTIEDYIDYLPNAESLGWCCTTSSGDYPYEIRTYDFESPTHLETRLQFEFLMEKNYGIEHKRRKVYAARLFCTPSGTGMRFYLERRGYSHYKHLKIKEE